jgi:hypothetical protein
MKRNVRGGFIVPAPGGYQHDNAGAFAAGTEPMVGTSWDGRDPRDQACDLCGCTQARTMKGTIRRRTCSKTCECHWKVFRLS